jgi:hypothetical protein
LRSDVQAFYRHQIKDKNVMKKWMMGVVTVLGAALLLFSGAWRNHADAQRTYTAEEVIEMVVQSEQFSADLATEEGWTANAYDTGNVYGVWRVDFTNSQGDELGWAEIIPARGRIYSWDSYFGVGESDIQAAEPALRELLYQDPVLIELLGDPSLYEMYFDFNGYEDAWSVYIVNDNGPLYITMRSSEGGRSTESLSVYKFYFADVLSYQDWQESKLAITAATAFQNSDVAAALRGVEGWTTYAEQQEDDLWRVIFQAPDGTTLASVLVDVNSQQVIEYNIGE